MPGRAYRGDVSGPSAREPIVVYTLGHSTRSIEDFLAIATGGAVERVADVRSYPRSRRYPWFDRDALSSSLAAAGIGYTWLGASLGGRRRDVPRAAAHSAFRVAGFRAYAAHMETSEFVRGVRALLDLASHERVAALCAERHPSRCHRGLLADYLTLVVGVRVVHLLAPGWQEQHVPRPFARVEAGRVVYDRGEGPPLRLG